MENEHEELATQNNNLKCVDNKKYITSVLRSSKYMEENVTVGQNNQSNAGYITLRSRFVPAKKERQIIKANNLKMKRGFFSKIEAEIARTAIDEFLVERSLQMKDLQNFLLEDMPFPIMDLVSYVVSRLKYRTFKSTHIHIYFNYHPAGPKNFTDDDSIRLLELVKERGFQWLSIGRTMEKYRDHCRTQFLILTGERKRHLVEHDVKDIFKEGIPKTEEEWDKICEKYGVSKKNLEDRLRKYSRKITFAKDGTCYDSLVLLLHVLFYNYFCSVHFSIKEYLLVLEAHATRRRLA